jgi:AhpD family alkylhydroperoxidase
MTRISGVSARQAGPFVKLAYFFMRRNFTRLTGRESRLMDERMIEPLKMYAHVPGLLRGIAGLEQATARLHRLDEHLKNLAELKAATLTHCEYCIDLGSLIAQRSGLSEGQLLALPSYRTSKLFSGLEKLVLGIGAAGFSEGMVYAVPATIPDRHREAPPPICGGESLDIQ